MGVGQREAHLEWPLLWTSSFYGYVSRCLFFGPLLFSPFQGLIGSHFTSHSNTKIYRYNPWFRAELCLGSIAASIKILTLSRRVRRTWPLSKTFIFNYICRTLADLTCSLDLFFLCFLGSIRVLKPKNESFCALSEPSVRFRISELRFGNYLTRKRSLVRVQSCHCFQCFIFP